MSEMLKATDSMIPLILLQLPLKKAHEHWAHGLFFANVSGGPRRTEAEHSQPGFGGIIAPEIES